MKGKGRSCGKEGGKRTRGDQGEEGERERARLQHVHTLHNANECTMSMDLAFLPISAVAVKLYSCPTIILLIADSRLSYHLGTENPGLRVLEPNPGPAKAVTQARLPWASGL